MLKRVRGYVILIYLAQINLNLRAMRSFKHNCRCNTSADSEKRLPPICILLKSKLQSIYIVGIQNAALLRHAVNSLELPAALSRLAMEFGEPKTARSDSGLQIEAGDDAILITGAVAVGAVAIPVHEIEEVVKDGRAKPPVASLISNTFYPRLLRLEQIEVDIA